MTPTERELFILVVRYLCNRDNGPTISRMFELKERVEAEAGAQPVEPTKPTAVAFTPEHRQRAQDHAEFLACYLGSALGRKVRVTIEPV